MKNNPFTVIVALASLAALMNLSWAAESGFNPATTDNTPCKATGEEVFGEWVEAWMPGTPLDPLANGCEDCTLSDIIVEVYCESRGSDCDGFFGWNESYKWDREKRIYQCGTPGQQGYGWFIDCLTWIQQGCCNNGTSGLPPTGCSHGGAALCSTRIDDN